MTRTFGARAAQNYRFFAQAVDQVSQLPGVLSASAVMCPPLGGTCWTSPYQLDGTPAMDTIQQPWTALDMVMRRYFETLETPLIDGRYFGDSDSEGAAPVAILSQSFARRLFPNGGAIGKRLRVKYAARPVMEVVGVVADIKQAGLEAANMSELYVPPRRCLTVVVRPPATLGASRVPPPPPSGTWIRTSPSRASRR